MQKRKKNTPNFVLQRRRWVSVNCHLNHKKLVAVVIFLVVAGFSNWIALAYIHDIVGRDPLPDVVFSLIPEQPWALGVGDLMVTFSAVLIRRTLFILGILYALRTICMLVTQLPSGYANNEEKCRRQVNYSERTFSVYARRVLEQTVHVGFQLLCTPHLHGYVQDIEAKMLCGDLLYSGHTLIMVVCWLTIHHYLPASIKWLHYIVKMFMVLGMACMVMSRTHYSIDVLFAYCFSVGVFTIYHAFCEIDTYRERKHSILREIIENQLEIPFGQKIYRNLFDPTHRSRQQDKSMSNCSSDAVMQPSIV
uniref:Sphingomyelin synthase-like domain-containing protein n=1 Tax=Ditylenchus dipsaci TaxID=166011 RepID=A0A915D9A9_9BILA